MKKTKTLLFDSAAALNVDFSRHFLSLFCLFKFSLRTSHWIIIQQVARTAITAKNWVTGL